MQISISPTNIGKKGRSIKVDGEEVPTLADGNESKAQTLGGDSEGLPKWQGNSTPLPIIQVRESLKTAMLRWQAMRPRGIVA